MLNWRGFGLSPLEGVILKRTNGQWSAFHIKTDNYYEAEKVEVKELQSPKSGWKSFWKNIIDKEILALPDASEIDCDVSIIDGTSYVVEINQDKNYRTYRYSEGSEKCREAEQMEQMGELIGLEFDSGNEECKTTEWFACMTLLKRLNQTVR